MSHDTCRQGFTNSWYPNPSGLQSPSLSKVAYVGPQFPSFQTVVPNFDIVSPSQLTLNLLGENSRWIEVRVRKGLVLSRLEERPRIGHGVSSCCTQATAAKRQIYIVQRVHEPSRTVGFGRIRVTQGVSLCNRGDDRLYGHRRLLFVSVSVFCRCRAFVGRLYVSLLSLWLLKSPCVLTSIQESHLLPGALCLYVGIWGGFGEPYMGDCGNGRLGGTVATVFEDPSINPSGVEINRTGSPELQIWGTGFNDMATPVIDFDPPINLSNLDVEVSSHERCVLRGHLSRNVRYHSGRWRLYSDDPPCS